MTEPTSSSDSFRATAKDCAGIGEKLKRLVHEGNVRRVIVAHDGRTIAEFPLTAGVVGVVLAPALAAIGALVALLKDCTIVVERHTASESVAPPATAASNRVA
jgi:hypothetical protein